MSVGKVSKKSKKKPITPDMAKLAALEAAGPQVPMPGQEAMPAMKRGGCVKKARGGLIDGCATKGRTKGRHV